MLREAGDRPELAKLLCLRGQAELAGEEPGLARAELAEAEAMAAEMGVGADSELGRLVSALREALARQVR